MRKIISLFRRNHESNRQMRDEVMPGAEWVIAGEGHATRKLDGTCCLIRDGDMYKRHTVKQGKKAPPGFEAATEVDPETGKQWGWVPVAEGKGDKPHREAFDRLGRGAENGTYELLGPKINSDLEHVGFHVLVRHGTCPASLLALPNEPREPPRTFDGLREWFVGKDIEGIVWHHQDGRMVKIKGRDFGLKRAAQRAAQ